MRKIAFNLKTELKGKVDSKYNFSEEIRNKCINEISESIRKDVRLNEIKEAESVEYASKFVTTVF